MKKKSSPKTRKSNAIELKLEKLNFVQSKSNLRSIEVNSTKSMPT